MGSSLIWEVQQPTNATDGCHFSGHQKDTLGQMDLLSLLLSFLMLTELVIRTNWCL